MNDALTNETVELLQQLIRNRCVNDGSVASGQEVRNSDLLAHYLQGSGIDLEVYTPDNAPGPHQPRRAHRGQRSEGADAVPDGPHRRRAGDAGDVERAIRSAASCVNGEVWGRGAVDMLNLTASQAVALKALAKKGWKPRGTLVYLACADEEAGGLHGAGHVCKKHWDSLRADYLLTENGGTVSTHGGQLNVTVNVGEKGVAWRRLRVKGTPGHGSMPYGADNALVKAAKIITRLAEYRPAPYVDELWRGFVGSLDLDPGVKQALMDPVSVDESIDKLPQPLSQGPVVEHAHDVLARTCASAGVKTNVIPNIADIEVDIRTVPGDNEDEVRRHLDKALGDLMEDVTVEKLFSKNASVSPTGTPLWDVLAKVVAGALPGREAAAAPDRRASPTRPTSASTVRWPTASGCSRAR